MDRLSKQNIGSFIPHLQDAYVTDPVNASHQIINPKFTTTWGDAATILRMGICGYQNQPGKSGCWGWGIDLYILSDLMLPGMLWFFGFLIIRTLLRGPLIRLGYRVGVGSKYNPMSSHRTPLYVNGQLTISEKRYKTLLKFQNQVWLTCFYIASTIFGYIVQADKPWFTFPVNMDSAIHYHSPAPYNPPSQIMLYYCYGFGFYISELCSLLLLERKVKRMDFVEYIFHHFTTLALIFLSHLGWLHRFGTYVLFIHDASDIMLSLSKSLHYIIQSDEKRARRFNALAKKRSTKRYQQCWCFRYILTDSFVYSLFVSFIALFFYFRWYCLPSMTLATVWLGPNVFNGNFNTWLLVLLLNGALQFLHVYWGALIFLMIYKLLLGNERKDIRSEDDQTEDDEDGSQESSSSSPTGGKDSPPASGSHHRRSSRQSSRRRSNSSG